MDQQLKLLGMEARMIDQLIHPSQCDLSEGAVYEELLQEVRGGKVCGGLFSPSVFDMFSPPRWS